MQDHDIVAAAAAGDPAGPAAAYDRYAPALYVYCRSMLRDPEDAADALANTFVVAALKAGALSDPGRLRPWLYAVARNECLRRQQPRPTVIELGDAPDTADESAPGDDRRHHAELRDLVRGAIDGLEPDERETLELSLRHALDGPDLAAALGVSDDAAHALLSRAHVRMAQSLGALLVARHGQGACAELAGLLRSWDGQLTALLRKRTNRHIEGCDVCAGRRERELRPAVLLAALPAPPLPDGLRARVLRLVGDGAPEAVADRERRAVRAEPFEADGFPVALDADAARVPAGEDDGAEPQDGPRRRGPLIAGVAAVSVLLGLSAALILYLLSPSPASASLTPATAAADGPVSSAAETAPAPSPSAPSASPTPSRSPSPSPSPKPATKPPSGSPSAAARGTLVAQPTRVALAYQADGTYSGSFTLTAQGGPVPWFTISTPQPAKKYGSPAVTPASGSLAAGQTVTVTVTLTSYPVQQAVLTVQPGDIQITLVYLP